MSDDIDNRLVDEVTTLSTKLVTEVAKLLHLEEALLQLRKENAQLKASLASSVAAERDHAEVLLRLEEVTKSRELLHKQKQAAEAKNKQLEGEVEDLTASLFNEANEMVSNASREAYNFKLKNRKLIEELLEKDSIIENLQEQLRDLKDLFVKMEEKHKSSSRANTPRVEKGNFDFAPAPIADDQAVLQQVLFGVRSRAVRFDLHTYQTDFKAFVCQLIKKDFSFDLASLKTLKYFRRLWTEELEPSIPIIPALTGNTFINRWSKGKSFWGLLVEGKAIIEPVAGVNETFKLSYKGAKRGDEVPIALQEACAFCGEHKDDLLEHARLYNLKLYGPATETGAAAGNTTEIAGEAHSVVGTYPLCNFCLVKLRAICTFFANLRLVHANIYKLPQNSAFDDVAYVNSFQFKRSTESVQTPTLDPSSEPAFVKLYLMLLVLRAKIFWSRIGFWDTDEDVESINLDEIPLETFRALVKDNVAFHVPEEDAVLGVQEAGAAVPKHKENESQAKRKEPEESLSKGHDPIGPSFKDGSKAVGDMQNTEENAGFDGLAAEPGYQANTGPSQDPKAKKSKKKGKKSKKSDDSSRSGLLGLLPGQQMSSADAEEEAADSEFQDSGDTFENGPPLQRRKSKTKEFKAKMNKDLDSTLAALQESLE